MTSTTRTSIEFIDLKALQLRCGRCPTVLILSLGELKEIPGECPNCHTRWGHPNRDYRPTGDYVLAFAEALHALVKALADSSGTGVNFDATIEIAAAE